MRKSKKLRNIVLGACIVPLVVIMSVCLFTAYRSISELTSSSGGIVDSIEEYDYHLRADPTELQITLFEELAAALYAEEVDEEEIAALIVENFVADFYTWTNKNNQYDIGGMYYVYTDQRVNIYDQARDTFYLGIDSAIQEYGSEGLIEIAEVEATATALSSGYDVETEDDDGETETIHYESVYYVICTFSYTDCEMDTSSLITSQDFIVIINDETGRYEIVEALGESTDEIE